MIRQLTTICVRVAIAVAALCATASVWGQERGTGPGASPDEKYRLLSYNRIGSLKKELAEASAQGFAIQFVVEGGMLLKKDGSGPHTYTIVANNSNKTVLKELNEAGAQGFRLLPASATVHTVQSVVALEKKLDGATFSYSMIKSDDAAEKALSAARASGSVFVSVSKASDDAPMLVLEQQVTAGTSAKADTAQRDYRVASTNKTTTLETEIRAAAAQGFRAVGFGFLTVVLEREGSSATPIEYRLIAARSGETAATEMAQAGVDGFRVVGFPLSNSQLVCLLEKVAANSQRVQYRLEHLKEVTANSQLRSAEADGYQVVGLLHDIAVLEKRSQ